jgi:hypothetical protein
MSGVWMSEHAKFTVQLQFACVQRVVIVVAIFCYRLLDKLGNNYILDTQTLKRLWSRTAESLGFHFIVAILTRKYIILWYI